jgi:hypothetical protein
MNIHTVSWEVSGTVDIGIDKRTHDKRMMNMMITTHFHLGVTLIIRSYLSTSGVA